MVLVDDRTGGVVLDLDLVEQRRPASVCDNDNAPDAAEVPVHRDFARTEGGPATASTDVNTAYDLAGVVSTSTARSAAST